MGMTAEERETVQPGGHGASVFVSGVAKVFQGGQGETVALEDVTFDVEAGQFVSIIGPSGCGKTTIVRMIGDLLAPTKGEILVDGVKPSVARKNARFGFVFQRATLLDWRDLRGNVALPLDVLGWPRARKRARSDDLLELVGLDRFAGHFPDQVSGGMQQRVSIARALSFDPGILIMDEPFGALDMITRDRMGFELLRIWKQSQKTVLFVTHSIDEAVLLSDKVVAMGTSPGHVEEIVHIDIERPRRVEHRQDPRFIDYAQHLRRLLEH
jgi:NitT/TauT family transport system ATP-binding protein